MVDVVEDGKVITASTGTIYLQYSQILNESLTLFISICTAIYVGRKAYKAIMETYKDIKKCSHKRKH